MDKDEREESEPPGGAGRIEIVEAARRAAEDVGRESNRRFDTLIANLPGMAYRCRNDPVWTMEFVSEGCRPLTGFAPDELMGNARVAYGNLIVPEDRQRVWQDVQAALDRREPFEFVYTLTAADGGRRCVWERGCGVFDRRGELLAIEGFITDITDRLRAEEERRLLDQRIQQAQKLESLGVLAGGVAHDFNNLLTAIMGNINLALLDLPPDSPIGALLAGAENAAQRAAGLARQMLAYSGHGRFAVQRLNLRELIEGMDPMLRMSIPRRAVLRLRYEEPAPEIEADAGQIRQVVMNLVVNGAEALGERDGVITVSAGSVECDRACLAGAWPHDELAEGRYAFVEVSDTGCGIPQEQMSRIFDPFYSTKFAGRGLGLPAAFGIVRGHKGAIVVHSEVGKGTGFRVLLPVAAPSAPP